MVLLNGHIKIDKLTDGKLKPSWAAAEDPMPLCCCFETSRSTPLRNLFRMLIFPPPSVHLPGKADPPVSIHSHTLTCAMMRHVTPSPVLLELSFELEVDAMLTADLFLCWRSFAPRTSWPNSAVVSGNAAHFPFLFSSRSPTLIRRSLSNCPS